tara:strand:+ start:583 stop:822 length:240 start_codon:yes stop_codon:yes gene_type:complete
MRNQNLQRLLFAAALALSAGAIVAHGNPVTRLSHDADDQAAVFAQAARTIGTLVVGVPVMPARSSAPHRVALAALNITR